MQKIAENFKKKKKERKEKAAESTQHITKWPWKVRIRGLRYHPKLEQKHDPCIGKKVAKIQSYRQWNSILDSGLAEMQRNNQEILQSWSKMIMI